MHIRLGTLAALVGSVACLLGALVPAPARAQIGSDRYSAIVFDHRTGNVLFAASADETRHPASLTKMMTLYMTFEALREGRLTLTSPVPISAEAASRPPTKLGVPPGQQISVEQAILALITRSANDVATALGERLGGSEPRFAQMMTMRARALGMSRTTFRNASGLPDLDQVTTARDMATLGRRLIQDFPTYYRYFGYTHAMIRGSNIRNHNRMLTEYDGVDGIKTGYIRDSGFNIVTSASRGGARLVGAVFGGSSWYERDQHMAALLDQGFAQLGVTARGEPRSPMLVRQAVAAPLPSAQATAPTRQIVARPAVVPARSRTAARATTTVRATTATRAAPARNAPRTRSAVATTGRPALAPPRAVATRSAAGRRAVASRAATTTRTATAGTATTTRSAAVPVRSTTPAPAPRSRTRSALHTGSARPPAPAPVPIPMPPVRPAERIRTAEAR